MRGKFSSPTLTVLLPLLLAVTVAITDADAVDLWRVHFTHSSLPASSSLLRRPRPPNLGRPFKRGVQSFLGHVRSWSGLELHAEDGVLLRPLADSDDDLWLEAARHVHQQAWSPIWSLV